MSTIASFRHLFYLSQWCFTGCHEKSLIDILLAINGEDSYSGAMTVSHGRFGGFLLMAQHYDVCEVCPHPLATPNLNTLKGNRDRAIMAVLLGPRTLADSPRRVELAN
jgi:hypothetical protein